MNYYELCKDVQFNPENCFQEKGFDRRWIRFNPGMSKGGKGMDETPIGLIDFLKIILH